MFSKIAKSSVRQKEIFEVVLRNGWDYMRRLLTGGKPDEPKLPTPAVLCNILIELGPVYVKLGQLLSTRPDLLPQAYIEELTALQADVPFVAWAEVEALLQEQMGGLLPEKFETFDPTPVAAGSIAQTHQATLPNGRKVAVKIQRPGIDKIINQDVMLLQSLAELADLTDLGETYDFKELAQEFTTALKDELDFAEEASFTDRLRRNLSKSRWFDAKQLVIPEIVWELTTQKVLVMEWLDGKPLLSWDFKLPNGSPDQQKKKEIATLLTRVFFQQICLDGFFHADPHPGNLFYLADGRVALLDCGMIGRLDPVTQQVLIELLLAMVNLDAQRCAQLTLQLSPSAVNVNLARLETDYDRLLRKYYNLPLTEISFGELFYEVLETSRTNQIRLPSNLGLCAKTMGNLEGVARCLRPEYNLSEEIKPLMTDLFTRQLVGEAPLPAILRTALDVKNLSLQSPRQMELLLERVTSERLRWNVRIREVDGLRRSIDDSANRLSFSILVGALIMGAAIISAQEPIAQVYWVSEALFATASLLGLWLIISILRSGKLR